MAKILGFNPFIEAALAGSAKRAKAQPAPRMVKVGDVVIEKKVHYPNMPVQIVPISFELLRDRNLSRSKYIPHQSNKECARRAGSI